MQWIAELGPGGKIAAIVTALVALATVIVALTPTQSDNKVLDKVFGFLQRVGFLATDAAGNRVFSVPFLQGRAKPQEPKA